MQPSTKKTLQTAFLVMFTIVIGFIVISILVHLATDERFNKMSEFQKQCQDERGTYVRIHGQALCFDGDLVKRFGEQ